MDLPIEFQFRNKQFTCIVFIDSSSSPCYIFAELQDADLIAEFGNEITVKTDFKIRLSKKDDYPALAEVRQSIFMAVKRLPEFTLAYYKIEGLKKVNPRSFIHPDG